MKEFKNGLVTGLVLQLAIGPVFFFIVNLTLQKTIIDGFVAVAAATLVDYFYITLAILGIGKLLEKKKIKKTFGIISSVILMIFGMMIIKGVSATGNSVGTDINSTDIFTSFTKAFFLTISSPMTIIFWTGLFAAKAVEYNYSKRELFIFGLATGLATLLFMGASVVIVSLMKETVPVIMIQLLNLIVGILLTGYGVIRLIKV
jgi:threonine/homoserine/homoserine lactone efflux protein